MTDARYFETNRKAKKIKAALITVTSLMAFAVFFVEAPIIIDRMGSGLKLCANIIIPSLFPYMILSELLIFSGIDKLFEKAAGGIFERIFGLPRCAASAFVLGILCGFPVGTKISYSLYENNKISKDELTHLLLFCNIQSSAFIINTVGISLLGSKTAGILLYISTIISLIISGILYAKFFPHKSQYVCIEDMTRIKDRRKGAVIFTDAVRSSALGIISICGFVLFFYVLCGIIADLGQKLDLSPMITLAISSMLEMSCGCIEAARTLDQSGAFIACAMILGFSGISVHFQITSLCPNAEIKYGRFFLLKILSAALAGICAIILNFIFKIFV